MTLKFWPLMATKDIIIYKVLTTTYRGIRFFNFREKSFLRNNKGFKNKHLNDELYLILNGPSLNLQDLSSLKGKNLMFVNRGFKHPLYRELAPKFHVFIDPKMISGEWDTNWIDEILELSPNTTIVLPVKWASHSKFKNYINQKVSILWIPIYESFNCMGVSGECFKTAIFLGFKTINFTGFDANGLAYELTKSSNSHFYGENLENKLKNNLDYVRDLYMYSRQLHDLEIFAKKCKRYNIKIFNLTQGGILSMFERKKLLSDLKNSNEIEN